MSLLNFFRRKSVRYQPVNATEQIIDRDEDTLDPRGFIRLLASRPLLVLGDFEEGSDSLQLRTAKGPDQSTLAFAFTSREALEWYLTANKSGPQSAVSMKGKDLFRTLDSAEHGVILNSGTGKDRVMLPANVKFVLSVMDGSSPDPQPTTLAANRAFTLSLPAETPTVMIRAISHYMRTHQDPSQALLGLRQFEGDDKLTWAVYLCDQTDALSRADEMVKDMGAVIAEVQDPHRLDLDLDLALVSPAVFDDLRRAAILITKDGHRDPQVQ